MAEGLHVNEAPGCDLFADEDGCWRDLLGRAEGAHEEEVEVEREASLPTPIPDNGTAPTPVDSARPASSDAGVDIKKPVRRKGKGRRDALWRVDAGPIDHRILSLGFVVTEPPSYLPLDTVALLPLLEAEREALALLTPEQGGPITNPRAVLSLLTSQQRKPFTLPSGTVLQPPDLDPEPRRKIVIMGDCSGVSNDAFVELAQEPSLLVHECTNAWIDPVIEKGDKGKRVRTAELDKTLIAGGGGKQSVGGPGSQPGGTEAEGTDVPEGLDFIRMEQERVRKILAAKAVVEQKARSRGHSTPDMVGAFARRVRARRVALNHFSVMFPSPHYATDAPFPSLLMETNHHSPGRPLPPIAISELHRRVLMSFIESQTTDAWHPVGGVRASAARDLMTYDVPAHELTHPEYEVIMQRTEEADRFQDLWRHEGATGITRVFGIRIAGLDKSISGIGYGWVHQRQEEEPAEGDVAAQPKGQPASTVDGEGETSSAAGDKTTAARGKGRGNNARGGAGRGRGGGHRKNKASMASVSGGLQANATGGAGGFHKDGQQPSSRGRRGHGRTKSTAAQ
ncbi:hypothetical protein QFC19_006637 [Naganishia cerealis]|uniref:Uncharacterized protein n=1 Tax=Naganishia cerealis TaxID=610337 RepID=A0ACC2VH04_9TREE|nr:hypothetical protein QFC19_006637 [Naganishia cerealis]